MFRARFVAQPRHCHLQLHHEEVDLTLLDEASQGFQDLITSELLSGEPNAFGGQVANCTVEYLQGEKFLNKGVVFEKSTLEDVGHGVLVDQSTLAREILVDDCQNGENVFASVRALEELVINAEDSEEELSSEGKVKFRVFTDEFSDDGEYVKHAQLDALVLGVVLSK